MSQIQDQFLNKEPLTFVRRLLHLRREHSV